MPIAIPRPRDPLAAHSAPPAPRGPSGAPEAASPRRSHSAPSPLGHSGEEGEETPGPSREPSAPGSPFGSAAPTDDATDFSDGDSTPSTSASPLLCAGDPDALLLPHVPRLDFAAPAAAAAAAASWACHLRPFAEQVAGRHLMFATGDGLLYKEADEKEVRFYEAIAAAAPPHPLQPFLPTFHAIHEIQGSDLVRARTLMLPACPLCVGEASPRCSACAPAVRVLRSFRLDPFAVYRFLAVCDITRSLGRPCVVDLKMGRRQYGYGASPAKVRSKERKTLGSTSRNLFFRVSGLRVYDAAAEGYVHLTKEETRALRKDQVQGTLARFFHDGRGVRTDALDQVLERLHRLRATLEVERGWHFITSSLLLVYDGDASRPPNGGVRMVDFAHTEAVAGRPDTEYLIALRNLIMCLECVRRGTEYQPPPTPRGREDSPAAAVADGC